jgi:5-methylcytosine-specific restriction endonuclease McrA
MTAESIVIPVRACIKCGCLERYKNGDCKACAKALAKAWHDKNKDRARANMAAWQSANAERFAAGKRAWNRANPEKFKAYRSTPAAQAARRVAARAWRDANPERFRAAMAAWRAKNPLEMRVYQSNARAKDLGRIGRLSAGLVAKLFSLQQGTCPCCLQPLGEDFQMDHIVAFSNGGENIDSNIQLLRAECNSDKFTKHPVDFMQERGFLL